jgi:hypothetical protein
MTTFEELCEKLCMEEECSLLELLELSSEDLVERFKDRIEDKEDEIRKSILPEEEEGEFE